MQTDNQLIPTQDDRHLNDLKKDFKVAKIYIMEYYSDLKKHTNTE